MTAQAALLLDFEYVRSVTANYLRLMLRRMIMTSAFDQTVCGNLIGADMISQLNDQLDFSF